MAVVKSLCSCYLVYMMHMTGFLEQCSIRFVILIFKGYIPLISMYALQDSFKLFNLLQET